MKYLFNIIDLSKETYKDETDFNECYTLQRQLAFEIALYNTLQPQNDFVNWMHNKLPYSFTFSEVGSKGTLMVYFRDHASEGGHAGTINVIKEQPEHPVNFALYEKRDTDKDRLILDSNFETPYYAFDALRQLSYGLQELGLKTQVAGPGTAPVLVITGTNKVVKTYVFVEQS
jgi:hypothetical protein